MSRSPSRPQFGFRHFLAALLLLALPSCSGDEGGTDPLGSEPGSLQLIGVPTEGTAGQTLAVTVEVRDTQGQPFSGATVTITAQGGIQVAAAQVVTESDGRGSTTATLPETAGTAGTVVREFASADDEPDQLVLASTSWFIFVDLVPAHRWDHPVRYVVVDVVTGEMTVEKAFGPPVIDGELHYLSQTERFESPDRFAPASVDGLFEKSCVRDVTFAGSPGAQAAGSGGPQEPGGGNIRVFTGSEFGEALRIQSAAGRIVGVVINGGEPGTDDSGNPIAGDSNWDRDAQQMQQTWEARARRSRKNRRSDGLVGCESGFTSQPRLEWLLT